jgi:RNA polymerase sigma-70 factor (ECF subfamily)
MASLAVEEFMTRDQRFLRYAKTGDPAILDSLIGEVVDKYFQRARRMTGDVEMAEEAVQEAFLQLVRTARHYDGSVEFDAWMGRLVCHAAIDQRRKAGRRRSFREVNAKTDGATDDSRNDQSAETVRCALDGLPEHFRMPLMLHYLDGLTVEETAKALSIPFGTASSRLTRACDQMRDMLLRAGHLVPAAGAMAILVALPDSAGASEELKQAVLDSCKALSAAKAMVAVKVWSWLAVVAVAVVGSIAAIALIARNPGPSALAVATLDYFPFVIEAETMSTNTTRGKAIPGGWQLWSTGDFLERNIAFDIEADYRFDITAKGFLSDGIWSIMELQVDQRAVSRFTVDSAEWGTYTVTAKVAAGGHRIAVVFMNDQTAVSRKEERDLDVDKIIVSRQ